MKTGKQLGSCKMVDLGVWTLKDEAKGEFNRKVVLSKEGD
jgi:hypothetical protein